MSLDRIGDFPGVRKTRKAAAGSLVVADLPFDSTCSKVGTVSRDALLTALPYVGDVSNSILITPHGVVGASPCVMIRVHPEHGRSDRVVAVPVKKSRDISKAVRHLDDWSDVHRHGEKSINAALRGHVSGSLLGFHSSTDEESLDIARPMWHPEEATGCGVIRADAVRQGMLELRRGVPDRAPEWAATVVAVFKDRDEAQLFLQEKAMGRVTSSNDAGEYRITERDGAYCVVRWRPSLLDSWMSKITIAITPGGVYMFVQVDGYGTPVRIGDATADTAVVFDVPLSSARTIFQTGGVLAAKASRSSLVSKRHVSAAVFRRGSDVFIGASELIPTEEASILKAVGC